jgi:phosphohistidine phosphatase
MDLILWRHADAADGQPDVARPLTGKGQKQARAMAQWLQSWLPQDLRILVSPALRAQETARALQREFETCDAVAVGQTAAAILSASGWPDAERAVMVVGHQPTLGEVAAQLLCGRAVSWHMAKGAVWWIRNRMRGDRSEVVLRLAITPDLVPGRRFAVRADARLRTCDPAPN